MSGQYNGFTAFLEKESPGHIHTWCYAHVLNLVLCNVTTVNVIYMPCHWFSCFCPFGKVTVNVLDVIVVRKLSPFKLLCLPPHLIDYHL